MESGAGMLRANAPLFNGNTISESWDGCSSNYNSVALTRVILNASNISSVYGRSDTVQPPAIVLIPQIRY